MRSITPLLLLFAGPLLAQSAGPSLQSLITNPPFGTAAQAASPGAPGTSLEFRGTFVEGGERFFSILDPNTRRAEWVGMNEPGRPFTVTSYDPDRETIVLAYQGRSMDLKLHSARVAAMPGPMPTNAQAGPANQPRPAQAASPSTSEAQRLAQVAEEIRRRRALRQQAQQQASGQNQNPPNDPPR